MIKVHVLQREKEKKTPWMRDDFLKKSEESHNFKTQTPFFFNNRILTVSIELNLTSLN